jgi:hypothetical protein
MVSRSASNRKGFETGAIRKKSGMSSHQLSHPKLHMAEAEDHLRQWFGCEIGVLIVADCKPRSAQIKAIHALHNAHAMIWLLQLIEQRETLLWVGGGGGSLSNRKPLNLKSRHKNNADFTWHSTAHNLNNSKPSMLGPRPSFPNAVITNTSSREYIDLKRLSICSAAAMDWNTCTPVEHRSAHGVASSHKKRHDILEFVQVDANNEQAQTNKWKGHLPSASAPKPMRPKHRSTLLNSDPLNTKR